MLPQINERTYAARVVEVHSGDDIILLVDLGVDGLFKRVRARLHRVDTPDAYKADSRSEAGKVREHVRSMLADKDCLITVHSPRKSGWLVTLLVPPIEPGASYTNLNEHLISRGYVYSNE